MIRPGDVLKSVNKARGVAPIEIAISVPLILLIAVGIFEFGRAYQTWQVLTRAAREGAKVAVVAGSTDAQVESAVRRYMTAGHLPNASTAPVRLNRSVAVGTSTGTQVTINYPFEFIVLNPAAHLVAPDSTGAPLTLSAVAIMRNES
ncbi:MAG TPA: TadE family protein [Vicinamibacterales bacterium]|jgi:Flp pilus assembly protein TadG